jgi:hypothetical protein
MRLQSIRDLIESSYSSSYFLFSAVKTIILLFGSAHQVIVRAVTGYI